VENAPLASNIRPRVGERSRVNQLPERRRRRAGSAAWRGWRVAGR
jgi:hypothetical protein